MYDRRSLAEVDSTNAEAMRLAPDLGAPTWIFATRQLAGRGRRGRAWSDPAGNFSASLLLYPKEAPQQAALRSFVASLALHDALSALAPEAALGLKWPNDVLLNDGKLAGILLEGSSLAGRMAYLVIGIGVNLMNAPAPAAGVAVPPRSLRDGAGVSVTPERFLAHLAAAYASREAQFVRDGFAPIRADWLARAARLGEQVTARTMQAEIVGRFETVDEDGNLVLFTAGGRQAIPAADVFFERGA